MRFGMRSRTSIVSAETANACRSAPAAAYPRRAKSPACRAARQIARLSMRPGDAMSTQIELARPPDADAVLRLVVQNGLPSDGLSEHLATALVAREGGRIVGTAALELY